MVRSHFRQTLASVALATFLSIGAVHAQNAESTKYYEDALARLNVDETPDGAIIQLKNAIQADSKNLPARVLLGQLLLDTGDVSQAAKELEEAQRLGADYALIVVPLAKAYIRLVEPERVISRLLPAGRNPDVDAELYVHRGHAYSMLNDSKQARLAYKRATELSGSNPDGWLGLSRLAVTAKKPKQAKQYLERAVEAAPDSYAAWFAKALFHRERRELDPTLEAYGKAIELKPDSSEAVSSRAGLYLEIGQRDLAIQDLDRAEELNNVDLQAIYLRTLLLFNEGKRDEAQAMLRERASIFEAITDDYRSKLPKTKLLLGIVAYFESNYEQAQAHLSSFLDLHPGHAGAAKYLASTLIGMGEWNRLITLFSGERANHFRNDPMVLSMLGEAYRRQGNFAMAERSFQRALEIAPNAAGIGLRLAQSRLDSGQAESVGKTLEDLAQRFPNFLQAQIQLVRYYAKHERAKDAIALIEKLTEQHPDNAYLATVAGAVYMANGDTVNADKSLKRARRLDPDLIIAQVNSARLAGMQGDIDGAQVAYEWLAEKHPRYTPGRVGLAQVLLAKKKPAEVRQHIDAVLQMEPENVDAHLLGLKALFAEEKLDMELAQTAIYEFLREFREDPKALLEAGKLYARLRDFKSAKLELRNAVEQAGFRRELLLEIAKHQIAIGDYEGAQWSLQKILTARPNDYNAGGLMVGVLSALTRFSEAEEYLNALLERHGETGPLLLVQSRWLYAQHRNKEAVPPLEKALKVAPSSTVMGELFRARIRINRWDDAIAGVESWLKKHPQDLNAVNLLAQTRLKRREFVKARELYERLHARAPENVVVLNNLATIYQRLNDPRAMRLAEQAYELAPNLPAVADTYGWILTESGQAEKALPMLRNAYARQSRDRGIRYHLGLALFKLGRIQEAQRELEGALEGEGDFADQEAAQQLLEKLRAKS
ncbi:MAG: XrtA/PEP-CTERM system TPR-repeat protein PrsT [Pseudomonadota bacterium]